MKRLSILLFSILILSSCAGVGEMSVIKVPGQNVSFHRPPSSWKQFIFTSTSQMPTGENLPVEFFYAAWRKGNLSSIGIGGAKLQETEKKASIRDGLVFGLNKEAIELRKKGLSVHYTITDESSGTLKDEINYTKIEADYICIHPDSNEKLNIKTVIYGLDSLGYSYTLQYKSLDNFFEHDFIVFKQLLDSITFGGS